MRARKAIAQARVLAGIAHGSRAFGGPYQAGLWLSNRCNLHCIHCYCYSPLVDEPNYFEVRQARHDSRPMPDSRQLHEWSRREADTQRTRLLIDELVRMGTWSFHFAGNGEPMLHADALEFMARVKRAGRACCMNTNGTLLDREAVEELVVMGFDELRITTMAGTADMYARTHPGSPPGTFARLRESLMGLAERKRAAGVARPFLWLCCVVVRQNAEALFDFVRFAHEVGADGVAFHPVGDAQDPCMAPLVPTQAHSASVREQLPELKRFLKERGVRENFDRFSKTFGPRLDTRALYRIIPCYVGWLSAQVDVDGSVYACCRCYGPLGNAYEQGMAAVWSSPRYREFRRAAVLMNRSGRSPEGCHCESCPTNGANLAVFRRLHPLAGRRALRDLRAAAAAWREGPS